MELCQEYLLNCLNKCEVTDDAMLVIVDHWQILVHDLNYRFSDLKSFFFNLANSDIPPNLTNLALLKCIWPWTF